MAPKAIPVPTFTFGTYRSQEGEEVTFTEEMLRELERNTNLVIKAGALTPPVGYDHPSYSAKDTSAHGQVESVTYRNGVLHLNVTKPSEQFVSDIRAGRRLRVSGEYAKEFSFVDRNGKTVKVGPTVIGLAALGRYRPALKNPALVPLAQLGFAETVPWASGYEAIQELRDTGFVSQTLDGTTYAFSEIAISPSVLGDDETTENEMDEKDFQRKLEDNDRKWEDRFKKFEEATEKRIASFSEEARRESEVLTFCETVAEEKPLGKLAMQRMKEALLKPSFESVRAFVEALPGAVVTSDIAGKRKKKAATESDEDDEMDDEPQAVSVLNSQHFAEMEKGNNEKLIAAGVAAFSEWQPEKFVRDGKSLPIVEQIKIVRKHVEMRDAAN